MTGAPASFSLRVQSPAFVRSVAIFVSIGAISLMSVFGSHSSANEELA